jgi:predicted dehydrogenase
MRRLDMAGGALMDLGVYPIHFALMFFGDKIKEIKSVCVKLDTGVDAQESITFIYEDGRMAVLYASMLVHCNRLGEINGTKGCIEVQNINNCEEIRVLDEKRQVIARYPVPEQINGYEYQILACKKAIEEGRLECPELPHEEILKVVRMTEYLRKEWGVVYPFE